MTKEDYFLTYSKIIKYAVHHFPCSSYIIVKDQLFAVYTTSLISAIVDKYFQESVFLMFCFLYLNLPNFSCCVCTNTYLQLLLYRYCLLLNYHAYFGIYPALKQNFVNLWKSMMASLKKSAKYLHISANSFTKKKQQ